MRVPELAGRYTWAQRQRYYLDTDARLRASNATSRRLAFVSLTGGVGASTLVAQVSLLAAARRGRDVLAIDAAGSVDGLANRLGLPAHDRVTLPNPERTGASGLAQARIGLPHVHHVHYLGFGNADAAVWPADVAEWSAEASPVGRFFGLVLTDWGRRRDLAELAGIARASHAVALVARADRAGLEDAARLVPAIRALDRRPEVVIALVDRSGAGAGAVRIGLGDVDASVQRIPRDRGLAAGHVAGRRVRRAWLSLGAALVGGTDPREDS